MSKFFLLLCVCSVGYASEPGDMPRPNVIGTVPVPETPETYAVVPGPVYEGGVVTDTLDLRSNHSENPNTSDFDSLSQPVPRNSAPQVPLSSAGGGVIVSRSWVGKPFGLVSGLLDPVARVSRSAHRLVRGAVSGVGNAAIGVVDVTDNVISRSLTGVDTSVVRVGAYAGGE